MILHQRHGWLEAPPGYWFRLSTTGKTYELCGPPEETTLVAFPFGTSWRATSILAEGSASSQDAEAAED